MRILLRGLAYLWASPISVFAALCAIPALLSGGGLRVERGALEIYGGLISWGLRRLVPLPGGALAMTLGHVILGCDRADLDGCRDHEHVHVRQYERWGVLFIPAYLSCSLWLLLRGRDAYRENPFEREAFS